MRAVLFTLVVPSLLLLTTGCQSSAMIDNEEAVEAESLEVQVDEDGGLVEIEYHVPPASVPAAVHAAMDRLYPGGRPAGAEREYVDGDLCWELTYIMGGREVEAMFYPDGTLYSEEVQVMPTAVPDSIRDEVMRRWPRALVSKWEEIRDGDRSVVGYHVKLQDGSNKYKAMFEVDGRLGGVVREVPAEIEVPVR